jgi:hypothetical protein
MSALLKLKPAMDFLRKQTSIVVDGQVIEHCHFGVVESPTGNPGLVMLPRTDGQLRVLELVNDQVVPSVWITKLIPHHFRGSLGKDLDEAVAVFNRQMQFKILLVVTFGQVAEEVFEVNPTVVRELELALLAGRVEASRFYIYLDEEGGTKMLVMTPDNEYEVLGKSKHSATLIVRTPITALVAEKIRNNEPWTEC